MLFIMLCLHSPETVGGRSRIVAKVGDNASSTNQFARASLLIDNLQRITLRPIPATFEFQLGYALLVDLRDSQTADRYYGGCSAQGATEYLVWVLNISSAVASDENNGGWDETTCRNALMGLVDLLRDLMETLEE